MEKQSKVLIVDDDPFALKSMARVLEGESYQVVTAASGSEALDLLKQDSFDLVLTDLKMPEVDGLEVLRQAREIAPQAVVLIFTGYASLESAIGALREGAYDYLVKPCSNDELKLKIARGLERVRLTEERQRAEEALLRERDLAEALEEAAAIVSSTLDPNQVLDRILEQVSRVVPNDATNIMLIKGDQARVVRWRGYERFGTEEFVSTVVFRIPEVANLQQMMEGREPMVIPNTATYPGWAHLSETEWLQSYAAAPIVVRGEVIGFLNVDSATPGFFTQAHAEALRVFADHAAVAIENARLYEETRQRVAELEALRRTSLQFTSSLDLPAVLDSITESTLALMKATDCHIYLYDEVSETFTFGAALREDGRREAAVKAPRRDGLTATVVREGRAVVINNAPHHPLYATPEAQKWNVQAIAGFPLKRAGQVLGVFTIAFTDPHTFSEEELRVLGLLADQAAIAIENARLYEETQQRALEQETLREAALALTTALDRNEVIDRILAQLQQVVPYDSASVQLLREDRMELVGGRGFPNLPDLLGISFPADSDNPNREVIRTRAPFIVEDAPTVYAGFRKDPHLQTVIRSWLGVPMLIGERLVGMIALDKREPGFYTQEHARLAEAFAAQAAVAIENARLFEEEQRRSTQLSLINEVGEKAASILDLDRLMQEVTHSIQESFNYYNVALLLLDEECREVVMQAVAGGFEHIMPGDYRQSLDEGIIGFVTRTGNSRLANDTSKDPCYVKGFLEEVLTRSELCVPIKLGDKVIGALDAQSLHINDFDQADAVAMETVADRIAIAIENARLYEETRQRALQLQTVEEIGRRVSSILDLNELFPYVAQAIQQSFGYYHVDIFLVEPATGYAVFKASSDPAAEKVWKEQGLCFKIGEEGMIGWVAHTGELLLANDVSQEPLYLPDELLLETRSELVVPLKVEERVVGVLDVNSDELNAFGEDDLFVLQTLANQVTIAIENARLFEETEYLKAFNESVVQGMAEAILIEDAQGVLTFANPAAEELLGYTREELIGQHWTTIVPEDDFKKVEQELAKRPRGTLSRYETALLSKEGQVIPVIVSAQPLSEDSKFAGVLTAFTDIRERVRREREIEERRMYLEGVLGAAPDAIVSLDAHHRIVEWNSGAERLFGYSREEVIGQNIDDLVTNPDILAEATGLTQIVMGGQEVPPTETIRYRKDGSPVDVIVAGSPILVGDELIGVVAVYTDITQRKRMEDTLRALALVDDLTDLYNRRGFLALAEQQLKTAHRAKRRMVLLFADFNGLKRINDTFGHPEGDRALIETANVLRETFRESDIMARIGGDEFVVLATETSGAGADTITTRLRANLEARNAGEGRRYKLSLSTGLARYDPEHPCSIDELLAQADRAMYERKRGDTSG